MMRRKMSLKVTIMIMSLHNLCHHSFSSSSRYKKLIREDIRIRCHNLSIRVSSRIRSSICSMRVKSKWIHTTNRKHHLITVSSIEVLNPHLRGHSSSSSNRILNSRDPLLEKIWTMSLLRTLISLFKVRVGIKVTRKET